MEETQEKIGNWHDKTYKKLLVIPAMLLLLSVVYLVVFYQNNGDVINRDISLKGGTSITVYSETDVDDLRQHLSKEFTDFNIREISDLRTRKQEAIVVELTEGVEEIQLLQHK